MKDANKRSINTYTGRSGIVFPEFEISKESSATTKDIKIIYSSIVTDSQENIDHICMNILFGGNLAGSISVRPVHNILELYYLSHIENVYNEDICNKVRSVEIFDSISGLDRVNYIIYDADPRTSKDSNSNTFNLNIWDLLVSTKEIWTDKKYVS